MVLSPNVYMRRPSWQDQENTLHEQQVTCTIHYRGKGDLSVKSSGNNFNFLSSSSGFDLLSAGSGFDLLSAGSGFDL